MRIPPPQNSLLPATPEPRRLASWIVGLALALGFAASGRAASGDLRYVEVQSTLGQMYDTAISTDDLATFGFSIPRGTALPHRLYPVRNLGVPMIHKTRRPQYKEVLLRHPQRNYTEYLDPDSDTDHSGNPPAIPPTLSIINHLNLGTVTLFWPVTPGDWRLESAATLNSVATWSLIPPASYQINGNTVSHVTAVGISGARFFRLRRL